MKSASLSSSPNKCRWLPARSVWWSSTTLKSVTSVRISFADIALTNGLLSSACSIRTKSAPSDASLSSTRNHIALCEACSTTCKSSAPINKKVASSFSWSTSSLTIFTNACMRSVSAKLSKIANSVSSEKIYLITKHNASISQLNARSAKKGRCVKISRHTLIGNARWHPSNASFVIRHSPEKTYVNIVGRFVNSTQRSANSAKNISLGQNSSNMSNSAQDSL